MKRLVVLVMTAIVVFSMIACAEASEGSIAETDYAVENGVWEENFIRRNDNLNNLITDIDDETLNYYKTTEAQHKGTVLPITYDTYFYAFDMANGDVLSHETPISKQAFVYLPYGYNEQQHYNILYLYHGGGNTEYMWFKQVDSLDDEDVDNSEIGKGYAVNILDHAFEDGLNDPFIVVTPTLYYPNASEEQNAVSGQYMTASIAYDLRDLIPVVESKYSTYAENTDYEGLVDSRDHRAMSGLSMGSLTTYRSGVAQLEDIISWFAPMSGAFGKGSNSAEFVREIVIPAIEEAASNGFRLNMLLNMCGYKDIAFEDQKGAHEALAEYAQTSDNLNIGENYDFVVNNGRHMFKAWNLCLYDLIKVFFK